VDDDELFDQIFVSPAYAAAPRQYRADFSDPQTYAPMEPLYDDLRTAQLRCEEDLRAQREDGAQLVFQWEPDQDEDSGCPAALWRMKVQTTRVRTFLAVGLSVTLVGSWADGVARGALEHG
jgi:hypothetical protein